MTKLVDDAGVSHVLGEQLGRGGEGTADLEAVVAHGFGEFQEGVLNGLRAHDPVPEHCCRARACGLAADREDGGAAGVVDLQDLEAGARALGDGILGLREDDLVADVDGGILRRKRVAMTRVPFLSLPGHLAAIFEARQHLALLELLGYR